MEINDELLVAREDPEGSGYTWTLTSRLGHALREAEHLFGPRDLSWTLLGCEFSSEDAPQIWYPAPGSRQVIIQLSTDTSMDMGHALFQLCHEVIHCLSPNGGRKANVLEEGLATFFSIWYPVKHGFAQTRIASPKYEKALSLAAQLLAVDRDLIKKVREIEPSISSLTREQLLAVNAALPPELLDALLKPFYEV